MNRTGRRQTLLDRTFFVGLVLKGLDGVLELIGGILLLVVSPRQIDAFAQFLTQHELSEDPHDLIANALVQATGSLNLSLSLFGAIYLLLHGLVKVVLVWAVLNDRLWAYPWMIAFLLVFIAYQSYQVAVSFSWGLTLLTAFDILIVYLTRREYRINRRRRSTSARGRGASADQSDGAQGS
jgi:uncharacterized membrane protein